MGPQDGVASFVLDAPPSTQEDMATVDTLTMVFTLPSQEPSQCPCPGVVQGQRVEKNTQALL